MLDFCFLSNEKTVKTVVVFSFLFPTTEVVGFL